MRVLTQRLMDMLARYAPVCGRCQVPDEYLLKSRRPLLVGREVLAALVADWKDWSQTC